MEFGRPTTNVPEAPDNHGTRISRRTWAAVILVSAVACPLFRAALPSVEAAIPHVVWLAFHLLYGGTLAAVYMRQRDHTMALDPEVA